MLTSPELPLRDYVGLLSDSRRWGTFKPRIGDVVVITPPKSGTTWAQGILALLISGDPGVDAGIGPKSPWIDLTVRDVTEVMEQLEAQEHRRYIKTHTPFDGIPIWPELRYIAVYRHPIDVHLSMVKHIRNMTLDFAPEHFPEDPSESFRIFLKHEQHEPLGLRTIVNHYRQTLERDRRENVLRLHYADMRSDLASAMARIAAHVGIAHTPDVMAELVEAASFEGMKANADRFAPVAGQGFWHSDAGFFDNATSNKWEGVLSDADLAAYNARMAELLNPAERAWLEWGGVPG